MHVQQLLTVDACLSHSYVQGKAGEAEIIRCVHQKLGNMGSQVCSACATSSSDFATD